MALLDALGLCYALHIVFVLDAPAIFVGRSAVLIIILAAEPESAKMLDRPLLPDAIDRLMAKAAASGVGFE
ncbi:hypothetical protein R1538_34880 [Rhizobium leguminosarum]|uniref:hypothetical protein n=1 Tax=Rhizobium leguminosarum TaxID=384 RepID=UPI00293DE87F|nr:hypothetical protein [Rhizobium leguminosarum]MDV4166238.1 hypothetical protein [Rhizobium leguminosarum]